MNLREEALAGLIRCRLAEDSRISGLPIDIRIQDGDVHLLGMVETEQQMQTVELLLNGVCGVRQVFTDRLLVQIR